MNFQYLQEWLKEIEEQIEDIRPRLEHHFDKMLIHTEWYDHLALVAKKTACIDLMIFHSSKDNQSDQSISDAISVLNMRSKHAWDSYNEWRAIHPETRYDNNLFWIAKGIDLLIEAMEGELSKREVERMTIRQAYESAYRIVRSGMVNDEVLFAYGDTYEKAFYSYHMLMKSMNPPYSLKERQAMRQPSYLEDIWLAYTEEFDND